MKVSKNHSQYLRRSIYSDGKFHEEFIEEDQFSAVSCIKFASMTTIQHFNWLLSSIAFFVLWATKNSQLNALRGILNNPIISK